MTSRCALIMAGGTGGHIFPGLAVAEALRDKGWRVHWLGGVWGLNNGSFRQRQAFFKSRHYITHTRRPKPRLSGCSGLRQAVY